MKDEEAALSGERPGNRRWGVSQVKEGSTAVRACACNSDSGILSRAKTPPPSWLPHHGVNCEKPTAISVAAQALHSMTALLLPRHQSLGEGAELMVPAPSYRLAFPEVPL